MAAVKVPPSVVFVIVALFSSIFIVKGGCGLYADLQFDRSTGRGTATIDRLRTSVSGGRHSSTVHFASYHYQSAEGGVMQVETTVAPVTYAHLKVDEILTVRYLVSNPGQSRIDEADELRWHWRNDGAAVAIGLFFIGWSILIIFLIRRKARLKGNPMAG